mmetsp:Transcript_9828/g.16333  ORF Transcript_9828/g.16333 Transcript_9828/m.16333 type:complete len:264 (-) Transcript_9828:233-1024(-)|eukprot:CAMPEP_0119312866 /NCGR_PEP_ID=MMETSP1333-20130426/27058_1 /TAXON_ID=418940 /ORGANISM="Scyphosphaera apsteinii, Strain RCC1455" /LENGTH=263 /DNA_ID=CAMNT_0007317545 /DNA_START=99 /DNA_END=890 /DNA_ORIENTATION=+
MQLTIWGRSSSSNTQKVLWVLRELGLGFKLIPASARLGSTSEFLGSGPAFGVVDTDEYAAMNPTRLIPTLKDCSRSDEDSVIVFESHSIVRYLAMAYGPHLYGSTAAGMARASMWMDWALAGNDYSPSFGSANHHLIDEVARTPMTKRNLDVVSRAHIMYCDKLAMAEAELGRTGAPWLSGGADMTLADVPLGVELNRWSLCLHACRRDGVDVCDLSGRKVVFPRLQEYYARLLERPAFRAQVYNQERRHQRLEGQLGWPGTE